MKLFKTLLITTSFLLFAIGTLILVGDLLYIRKYGFDFDDVAEMTESDGPVDWPTGERPTYALFPAFTYALVFWLPAVAAFVWQRTIGKSYAGRNWRGTE